MLAVDGVFGLLLVGLWIFCIIDVITTPESACRNLPKIAWVLIVIVLAVPGAIVWLVAGRPWGVARSRAERPARPVRSTPARPVAPDDDEEFLAGLRARAEEQRRRAREQQTQRDEDPDSA
jgi:hypothetical protein